MSIEATVEQFIRTEILFEDVSVDLASDRNLISSGILDSLALLRLIEFIESTFNISLSEEDIDANKFQSIGRIKELVGGYQS